MTRIPATQIAAPRIHPTRVSLKRLDPDLPVPAPVRGGDAAADLPARIDVVIGAGERSLVPTGFAVAIPEGWCGLILPRSGLSLKHGVTVLNAPGLIDAGYRGELQVVLYNSGTEDFAVERGQRIAQLLISEAPAVEFAIVDELPQGPDDRGTQGFGSSG